jgi:predicted RNA-binding Zn-ribbon protein involved in translation (DUF1610 family)
MKDPRFFCDNCGTEVDHDVQACPHCGRFFASVRCPACGFSGPEKLFTKGCPSCGYSAPKSHKRGRRMRSRAKPPRHAAPALPLWVYILSAAALLFALVALFFVTS